VGEFDFSSSADKEHLLFLDDTSTSQQKRKDDRRKKESFSVEHGMKMHNYKIIGVSIKSKLGTSRS
jgi:hypothetical protein